MTETHTERETGSWFPVPDEAELPSDLRGLFAKARERLGFVPNVFRVYAFRPERLSAWFAHYRQLHQPTDGLSAADREMVAVVVSAANGCLYCLVAHGAALREELGDPVLGERISYDWRRANLDPRRTAICAYAEKLTLRPREVTRADLQRLLDAGLTHLVRQCIERHGRMLIATGSRQDGEAALAAARTIAGPGSS